MLTGSIKVRTNGAALQTFFLNHFTSLHFIASFPFCPFCPFLFILFSLSWTYRISEHFILPLGNFSTPSSEYGLFFYTPPLTPLRAALSLSSFLSTPSFSSLSLPLILPPHPFPLISPLSFYPFLFPPLLFNSPLPQGTSLDLLITLATLTVNCNRGSLREEWESASSQ